MEKSSQKSLVGLAKVPMAAATLTLTDGNYVRQIKSVDSANRRISVKYGPYIVEGNAADNDALALAPGNRVPFTMRNNIVTVSAPRAVT